VRKVSGFRKPSRVNGKAFHKAVLEISKITQNLINSLETNADPRNREKEIELRKIKFEKRFPTN